MKTDCSFNSEDESFDQDTEEEIKIIKKPVADIENISIIRTINDILISILEKNRNLYDCEEIYKKQKSLCFNSNCIPNISLYEYLIRIQKYTLIEKSTWILALIYIDRLCRLGKIILTCYNIHRILFTAVLLAIKYNEDNFFENEYYAKIAGVKNFELVNLEYNFFYKCNFDMYVDEETFGKYCKYINSNNNDNDNDDDNKIKKLFF